MIIELRPPDGAGPVAVGMERGVARRALELLGGAVEEFHKVPGAPKSLSLAVSYFGPFLFAHFNDEDRVEAVEIARPSIPGHPVKYGDLDVFAIPVDDLVAQLRRATVVVEEEDGHSFVAPSLLLAFWRDLTPEGPDDESGRHFDGVLVARPGYDD